MAATDSTLFAVRGQAFNFSAVIKSSSTGNPVVGGLTGLAGWVSKDGGAWTALTQTPTERAASAWVEVNLTASEMDANKVDVMVTATNTGSIHWSQPIATADLRANTERYDESPVLDVSRLLVDLHDFLLNRQDNIAAQQLIYNRDGEVKGQASIIRGDGQSQRSKIQ